MHATCSNCHSQFALDDGQVGPEGTAMRCSVCGYVFRVDPPGESAPAWQIATVDGDEFSAPDLVTVRQWITEGRLHPDDRVSRTGRSWVRLGEMPEFSSVFEGFGELPRLVHAIEPSPSESSDLGPPPEFLGAEDSRAHMVTMETLPQDASAAIELKDLVPRSERAGPLLDTDDSEELSLSDGSISEVQEMMRAEVDAPVRRVDEDAATVVARPAATPPPLGKPAPAPSAEEAAAMRQTAPIVERVQRTGSAPPPPRRTAVPSPVGSEVDESRPRSMLGAVTDMVKPITAKPAASKPDVDPADDHPLSQSQRRLKRLSQQDRARETPDEDSVEGAAPARVAVASSGSTDVEPTPRKRSVWPIVATLGVLSGVAVVFGVPQVRDAVFGTSGQPGSGETPEPPLAEVQHAQSAIRTADPGALAKADTALTARLQSELTPKTASSVRIALVEVISLRAAWSRLLAAVDPARAEAQRFEARDLSVRAARILAETDASQLEADRITHARAWVKVAEGGPPASILADLRPNDEELRLLVTAASLWLEPESPVPAGLVGDLMQLSEPSQLARCVLAYAYVRSGDDAGAQPILDSLMLAATPPEVAIALSRRINAVADASDTAGAAKPDVGTADPATEDPEPEDPEDPEDPEPEDPKPDADGDKPKPKPKPDADGTPKNGSDGDADGGKGMSVSRLIDVGCEKVENGNARDGLAMLEKALDRKFSDPDISICIGLAHEKLGNPRAALVAFERALQASPRIGAALRGAARAAARTGNTDKAVNYYERVLEQEPRNSEARAYVDKHKASSDGGATPGQG